MHTYIVHTARRWTALKNPRRTAAIAIVLAAVSHGGEARAQCEQWISMGGLPGVSGANCAAMWDPDGAGPLPARVVVSAYTHVFGSTWQNFIAMWDGAQWLPLGSGLNGPAWAMTVAANGDLVVAGYFSQAGGQSAAGIARWNGASWSALGSGIESGFAATLAALPNGDIVVGGELTTVGGVAVNNIARWNGATWDSMGGGVTNPFSGTVQSLLALPDGSVVVGGFFATAGGVSASGIAKWDGATWSPIGSGLNFGGTVKALARLSNGDLVAGGNFGEIGGIFVSGLARWNGSTWIDFGGVDGGNPGQGVFPEVFSLATAPNGDLLVGGLFNQAGGVAASAIARWDGSVWNALGDGLISANPADPFSAPTVRSIAVTPTGQMITVGSFARAGSATANSVAQWNGTAWNSLGTGTNDFAWRFTRLGNGDVVAVGNFTTIGGVAANRIARWNGSTWSPLGSGVNDIAFAVTAAPNGDILVGGKFTEAGGGSALRIARWNGSTWSAVGDSSALASGNVHDIAVMPDGDIVASGTFVAGTWPDVSPIARWNGASWAPVGPGQLIGSVYALQALQNGELFAGGGFNGTGGVAPIAIARWDGTTWSSLGSGVSVSGFGGQVFDLHLQPSGDLIVAGEFNEAGGNPAHSIARWDGAAWFPFGNGLQGPFPDFPRQVYAVDEHPSGDVIAVGNFTTSGATPVSSIARWDGSAWGPVGDGLQNPDDPSFVSAFGVGVRANGEVLAGGGFTVAGSVVSPFLARWACPSSPCDPGPKWKGMPTAGGANDKVLAAAVFNDGSGDALYIGGAFTSVGGVAAHGLARWNGLTWTAIPVEPGAIVHALAVHDDGTGPALYVGGSFGSVGSTPASNIARWTGSSWTALGLGVSSDVRALESFDPDGPGGKPGRLAVGGAFANAGGAPAANIALWNGSSWATLGDGTNGRVTVIKSWNDGSGTALFIGGDFTSAGGAAANYIARWSGSAWSTLSTGLGNFPTCMEVFNDGTGGSLFIGGPFFSAGATPAQLITRWDGTNFHPLAVEPNRAPQSLKVFNDGSGQALYAAGSFTEFAGVPISGAAKWTGSGWSALGSGLTLSSEPYPQVTTLATLDPDGPGPAPAVLVAGGLFDSAGALTVQNIASWGGSTVGPTIVQPPASQTVYTGRPLTLSIGATGVGPLAYQWRKNGQALTDGGRISGATTSVLMISPAVLSDAGSYDAVVTDDCGPATSPAATVTVLCYANCDGSTGTPALTSNDFQCFLNAYAGGNLYANCDGSTGTPALTSNDFQCFLNSYAGGCP